MEEIWGSKATSKKPLKLHKTTSGKTSSYFAILFRVKSSDFRFVNCFMSFLKFDLPQLQFEVSKPKVSYFEPFQSLPKGTRAFEVNVSKKTCAKLCFKKRSGRQAILNVLCVVLSIIISYRSSHRRSSVKKVFLEISQHSQEKTCARVSFLIKLKTFSEHLRTTASKFVIGFKSQYEKSQYYQKLVSFLKVSIILTS